MTETPTGRSRRLYLDNAATSFPKPGVVTEAMMRYATECGASPGRGSYAEAQDAARVLWSCRERLTTLINGDHADRPGDAVVFTLNTSDALNLAIKGIVRQRRMKSPSERVHLVTTAMDHNSVLRPFNALSESGEVEWTCVPVDPSTGLVDPQELRRAIRPDTALVAVVHASNVSGTIQPIAEIGSVCRECAVPLLVDAAQSIGHVAIDVEAMGIDLLAFPGHKGLLGPLGTGGLYIRPGLERLIATTREGGTGSLSEDDTHPLTMPDRFESGSHNTVGIAGLDAALGWILGRGPDSLFEHERELTKQMLTLLADASSFPGLKLIGPALPAQRTCVFAVVHDTATPHEMAMELEAGFGVLARAGIHCAPRAHKSFGTLSRDGALRISFGPFVQPEDVRYAADALSEVCRAHAGVGA
ncbi:MAG: aminotransferase class V-fold PLP-dependent enzyme [Planctomycetota bacterium]